MYGGRTLTLTLRLHVRRQPFLGRRQCETKKINEQNKTVQNHHSTASIAADPVRASHIANLPEHRLVRRILAWNPSVRYRSLGRRPHTWDYQLQAFCRYKGLGPWIEEAKYHHHWNALFEDFYTFCQM